jgi:hypothetical protein
MRKFIKVKFNLMEKVVLHFILCSFSCMVFAQQNSDNFEGKWRTEDGFTVEIVRKNNGFEGISLERQKVVMENLQFKENKWTALMIRPKDSLSAGATVTIHGDVIHIHMRKGFLSKKLKWVRLQ